MLGPRIIPCLLANGRALYKTVRFENPAYVGDPINAVRIFNDKEVDELIVVDFVASKEGRGPDFDLVEDLASECFMPLCYGGGVRSAEDVRRLFAIGVEKVAMNTAIVETPGLLEEVAHNFGSQSIVASIDALATNRGTYEARYRSGSVAASTDVVTHARSVEARGAGEILLTSIDREGTGSGFDLELIQQVAGEVQIPVVANGGAGTLAHFSPAVAAGASGVAAGSMFVFHGKRRAVLISYPSTRDREAAWSGEILGGG